ncbi:MAG: glycosyltransferase family 4 protein [Flavobacteriales bacterium]|jgi:glycosyltransferase involved in cell wall biosynthesis|nr:glycosyltransferase family 4 protein [Flavobacteriales bacterium]
MKTLAIFHPSSELYGADRIMVAALQATPDHVKKVVYLFSQGPLVDYIYQNVTNVEVVVNLKMPVIYRAIFTPTGVFKFGYYWLKFYRFLKREHKKHQFDLAYVNTLSCSLILPQLKWLKIKRFVHVHEIIDSPKLIGKVTAKLSRKYADRVVCVSNAVLNGLKRYDASIGAKAEVLYNGIKPLELKERTEESDVLNFYLFGRIKPEKGQWFLAETIAKLSDLELEKTHFTIVGSPVKGQENKLEELKRELEKEGVLGYCSFVPFVDDISQEMMKADVCLVPSIMKDPFPTTVLEAMSVGKAVIATSHGGAKEALDKTGMLIKPHDVSGFVASLRKLIKSPQEVVDLGEKAKNRFYQKFTSEVFNKNWNAFLVGIL